MCQLCDAKMTWAPSKTMAWTNSRLLSEEQQLIIAEIRAAADMVLRHGEHLVRLDERWMIERPGHAPFRFRPYVDIPAADWLLELCPTTHMVMVKVARPRPVMGSRGAARQLFV
jgi:hypothetical protein